jgi:hypothetical protein
MICCSRSKHLEEFLRDDVRLGHVHQVVDQTHVFHRIWGDHPRGQFVQAALVGDGELQLAPVGAKEVVGELVNAEAEP